MKHVSSVNKKVSLMAHLKTFGSRLRWVRQKYGLTLDQFGERIHVGRSYLSKLENGRNKKTSELLLQTVCRVFNVREEWLIQGEGVPFLVEALNQMEDSKKIPPPISPDGRGLPKGLDNALELAGMLLSVNPVISDLGSMLQHILFAEKYPEGVQLHLARIICEELNAQFEAKATKHDNILDTKIGEPLSDLGKLASGAFTAGLKAHKLSREAVKVS